MCNPLVVILANKLLIKVLVLVEKVYPSTNLFDGYLKTCWVSGSSKTNKNASLYIRLPDSIDLNKIILNIFPGYGKSESLFYANARPKQISLSLLAAFYPEGFSTEVSNLYIMKEYSINKKIELADTFGIQSFPLNFDKKVFLEYQKGALAQANDFSGPNYKSFPCRGAPLIDRSEKQRSSRFKIVVRLRIEHVERKQRPLIIMVAFGS